MDDGANCCTSDTILLTTSERSSPVVSTYVSSPLQRYEELQQLAYEVLDVVQLHQRDDQLQRATADGGVALAQTAENGRPLAQYRVLVDGGHFQEQRKRHEADVGVVVLEEGAEDVGCFENMRRRHLQRHQYAYTLVENCIARHGGRFGSRDDLHGTVCTILRSSPRRLRSWLHSRRRWRALAASGASAPARRGRLPNPRCTPPSRRQKLPAVAWRDVEPAFGSEEHSREPVTRHSWSAGRLG